MNWRGWRASMVALAIGTVQAIFGRWRFCVVCNHRVPAFLPWRGGLRSASPLVKELGMVGSNLDQFACPRCGCNDRDRHLRLYLEKTGVAQKFTGARILHFAPEPQLVRWIRGFAPATYELADLSPASPEIQTMNLEEIPSANSTFDFVIANHVLEHVNNLDSAIGEIERVLENGGEAILQTPWCSRLSRTFEDEMIVSPTARRYFFGQEDHVRLFGCDIFTRVGNNSLVATPISHDSVLSEFDQDTYGLNVDEPFMLFTKDL